MSIMYSDDTESNKGVSIMYSDHIESNKDMNSLYSDGIESNKDINSLYSDDIESNKDQSSCSWLIANILIERTHPTVQHLWDIPESQVH